MFYKKLILFTLLTSICFNQQANTSDQTTNNRTIASTNESDRDFVPLNKQNFQYGIFVTRTLHPGIHNKQSIDQIIEIQQKQNKVRDALVNGLKKTFFPFVKMFSPALLAEGVNLQEEILKGLNFFAEELKQIEVSEQTSFSIMIVPSLSDELVIRNTFGEVPLKRFYAQDKYTIYEPLPDTQDAFMTAEEVLRTKIYKGMGKVMADHYYYDTANPFFVSLELKVVLKPNKVDSKIKAQAIIGMPVNKEMPFTEENEQIAFNTVKLPSLDAADSLLRVSSNPVAFVNIDYPFDEGVDPMMHIEFGPLGTYQNGGWTRPNGTSFKNLVPKLIGIPKVRGVSTRVIAASFNIFNLSINLKKMEISDLDLILSVGLSRFPAFSIGSINKTSIDEQFQTEINKAVQEGIADQKKSVPGKLTTNLKMQSSVVSGLMEKIFTVSK
ncbi:MAG: hypothetical protein ISR65_16980 [Bacteriovoracaceae bacterium]|nr:hypothetical protein [Bacteriovoracaceae bacterium]